MKLTRSTYYYRLRQPTAPRKALEKRIVMLCAELPRYGYRRITAQLRTEGMKINHKALADDIHGSHCPVSRYRGGNLRNHGAFCGG
jgi:hypothetical protein